MKQTSILTRNLAEAQERTNRQPTTVCYRLYTEEKLNLPELVGSMFAGATIFATTGLWQFGLEHTCVIEIIDTPFARQRVLDLAQVIRQMNNQTAVLYTEQPVTRFDVTRESINIGAL